MKLFLALSAVILAVSALPTDIGEVFDDDVSDVIYDAANFTDSRIPAGQVGFATVNGGTLGGNGGAVWTVWDAFALRNAVAGNERRVIYVRGRIDLTVLFTASPGVRLPVGNFKTIIGGDANAMIFGGGLRLNGVSQVIIQNIKFHNALSYAPGERPNGSGGIVSQVAGEYSEVDAIDCESSTNVWIDHNEFADDPWHIASLPANMRRHDGLIDIKRASNWISISNNIFRNHNHVMLVGHNDNNAAQDNGRLKVTYYRNWFMGTTQRNPRVRYGEVHVFNNLYTDIGMYGTGVGAGARIYHERNVCVNSRRCWGYASGVPNPAGAIISLNNVMVNSGNDANIPGQSLVSFRPSSYYSYTVMNQNNVEAHVKRYAGVW